jgi:hypothetical protein
MVRRQPSLPTHNLSHSSLIFDRFPTSAFLGIFLASGFGNPHQRLYQPVDTALTDQNV